ncbi:MAG: cob(I)yrinic acid a,c-diamide adenosyltransferase [Patescibacteria group bacterium]|nr:cob(I)yrinic acid a,c-diamide adenosyltransferase [Patescibacteria group bacterium]
MRTKFFTGEGDRGESEVRGKKISKSNTLIDLLGGLDELNSWVGFCRVEAENNFSQKGLVNVSNVVGQIQESLFVVQAEVAALGFGYPKSPKINEDKTRYLETIIKEIDSVVPKIEKFIIVGGSELSARLDVARAIARRTERQAKKYSEEKQLREPVLKFLNRLSSILFALARYVNHELGIKEENPSY